jgi:hypothetical protein
MNNESLRTSRIANTQGDARRSKSLRIAGHIYNDNTIKIRADARPDRQRNGFGGVRLIVAIHPRGATLSQDFHRLLGALRIGLDQDKLAIVVERNGVGVDHICRHMMIGKMGFESLDDCVLCMLARLVSPLGFGTAAPCCWRSIARRKDRRTAATWLSPHDALIINRILKPCPSQSLDAFFQVPGVVKYPYYSSHFYASNFCVRTCDIGTGR